MTSAAPPFALFSSTLLYHNRTGSRHLKFHEPRDILAGEDLDDELPFLILAAGDYLLVLVSLVVSIINLRK